MDAGDRFFEDRGADPTAVDDRPYLYLRRTAKPLGEAAGMWRLMVPFRKLNETWQKCAFAFDKGLAGVETVRCSTLHKAQKDHKGLMENFYAEVLTSLLPIDFYVADATNVAQIRSVMQAVRSEFETGTLEFATHFQQANESRLQYVFVDPDGKDFKVSEGRYFAFCKMVGKNGKLNAADKFAPVRKYPLKPKTWEVLGNGKFVILDTETTGYDYVSGNVIEVGALLVDSQTLAVENKMSRLIAIQGKLDRAITRLTGITDRMLAEQGSPAAAVMAQLRSFVGEWPIVAHNAGFDKSFVDMEFIKNRLPLLANRWIDSIDLFARYMPDRPTYSLSELPYEFMPRYKQPHRALGDVELVLMLFRELKADPERK